MGSLAPRAVFVTRETDYELLIARHATHEQARFYLESRGQRLADVEQRHGAFHEQLRRAKSLVPPDWRHANVRRADLDRFLFEPEDVVIAFGQDGLVANLAKYLSEQPVIGVNPLPSLYDGVLVRFAPFQLGSVLGRLGAGDVAVERRTMARAQLDNGESLLALNELFVGHRSHQSARYRIAVGQKAEEHSSSGIIVATGTGATGWARSIMQAIKTPLDLRPDEPALAYFVREPFPSNVTGTSILSGKLAAEDIAIISHMNEGGVIFADGIEQDFLSFDWGRRVSIEPAPKRLHLVTPD
jgi:NAD kinase